MSALHVFRLDRRTALVNNAGITIARPLLLQQQQQQQQQSESMALGVAGHDIHIKALLPSFMVIDLNRDFLESEASERLRSPVPPRRFGELADLDGPLLPLASEAGWAIMGALVAVKDGHLVSPL